ncbi:hypothetical protein SANA_23010 [Gottschalkiaceae bacterium SANA]|nr:hypothetical protein SANA_23010 [Gottschalkiaceae bacterium SANA]
MKEKILELIETLFIITLIVLMSSEVIVFFGFFKESSGVEVFSALITLAISFLLLRVQQTTTGLQKRMYEREIDALAIQFRAAAKLNKILSGAIYEEMNKIKKVYDNDEITEGMFELSIKRMDSFRSDIMGYYDFLKLIPIEEFEKCYSDAVEIYENLDEFNDHWEKQLAVSSNNIRSRIFMKNQVCPEHEDRRECEKEIDELMKEISIIRDSFNKLEKIVFVKIKSNQLIRRANGV